MGNNIILCEGETDQTLIGCYMEKTAGWKFEIINNSPFPKEKIIWYKDKNDFLDGIWQVGGSDFTRAIQSIAEREKNDHMFDNIVIITDHDDQESVDFRLEQIKEKIISSLDQVEIDQSFSKNRWSNVTFTDNFSSEWTIQILYLLVPMEETGALETFMMDALSEQSPEKENVIAQAKEFVANFQSSYYLKKRREKTKAELGISMSVFSPDRIFTTMKELLDSVEWGDFSTAHIQFDLLKKIY